MALASIASFLALTQVANAAPTIGLVYQIVADGTPNFDAVAGPGFDTGAANGITRNLDIVILKWAVNLNGQSADTATISQTLPIGMVWEKSSIPAFCNTSTVSADGRTVTCELGATPAGTAYDATINAKVAGTNPNGAALTMPPPTFVATNSTGTATAAAPAAVSTIPSGKPNLDLRKDFFPSDYSVLSTGPFRWNSSAPVRRVSKPSARLR
jgi:hypothetical protein